MSKKSQSLGPLVTLSALVVVLGAGLVIVQSEAPKPTASAAYLPTPTPSAAGVYETQQASRLQRVELRSAGVVVVTTSTRGSTNPVVRTGTWLSKENTVEIKLPSETIILVNNGTSLTTSKRTTVFGAPGVVFARVK